MPSDLTDLHDLLGATAFGRVKTAFAVSAAAGVQQLTAEWADLPQAARAPVKAEVRAGLLTGWWPGRTPYSRHTLWTTEDGSNLLWPPRAFRPRYPSLHYGLAYYAAEVAALAALFAAWPA